ncbi:hypothetical protein HBE96_21950 [Clostridium sp. P21]|uniref:Uncharacterized protein n=1 Tax=Clostridium muellerianum TaxID=2716538 RepID=A0A7Y0HRI8_9CLOT|nr:hypothetical protein [Clostridium muellerianum]NMM65251.1 hypothetical protein [Clostridium muellerianum]
MDKDLVRGITFQIDKEKRLGNMRIDWEGSRGNLCNQWNPTKLLLELKTGSKIDLKKLQHELNYLQFELLSNFQRVEKYCEGTGYNKETILSISLDIANYAIRLIPSKDAYSCIYVYLK